VSPAATVHLALFGDSIAAGVGATRTQDALAALLAADLRTTGAAVEPRTFAVSGARSAALPGQVSAAGDWPDLAVVVVGANDIRHLVPAGQAVADLTRALSVLRGHGVEVVLVPAPDLGAVARVPVGLREFARAASAGLRAAQGDAVRRLGVRVVDTAATSAAFAADPAMFSADAFHPSSAGYRVLADALAPAVREAVAALAGSAPGGDDGHDDGDGDGGPS